MVKNQNVELWCHDISADITFPIVRASGSHQISPCVLCYFQTNCAFMHIRSARTFHHAKRLLKSIKIRVSPYKIRGKSSKPLHWGIFSKITPFPIKVLFNSGLLLFAWTYQPAYQLESTVFFSHNKSASAGLSADFNTSRTSLRNWFSKQGLESLSSNLYGTKRWRHENHVAFHYD